MYSFELYSPLWLLLLIPWFLAAFPPRRRLYARLFRGGRGLNAPYGAGNAILFSDISGLTKIPVTFMQRIKSTLPWLLFLSGVLAIVALARPRQGEEEFRVQTEGIAIEMVVDRSGSMRAMDFILDGQRVNRLDAVKDVFRKFVVGDSQLTGRRDDTIGLISFGGYVEDRCPLTLDHTALLSLLDEVKIPEPVFDSNGNLVNEQLIQEEMQTAIGDALAASALRLSKSSAKSKILIFLSDGEQTTGALTPDQGAKIAQKKGIKVYTIGIGSTGVAPFPEMNRRGETVLVQAPVRLDETALKQIANMTGGQYFNARSTDALKQVYETIDKLEKSKTEGQIYTSYKEWYEPLLWAALGLLLVYFALVNTRFRTIP